MPTIDIASFYSLTIGHAQPPTPKPQPNFPQPVNMQATPLPSNSPVSNPSLRTQKIAASRGKVSSKKKTIGSILQNIFTDYEKNSRCLIFAVNKYPNAKKLDDLKCAVADGLLVAETLCGCTPVFEDSSGIWESPKEGNEKKGKIFRSRCSLTTQ